MPGLSKSRLLIGLQCPKWLYLAVNEPDATDYSQFTQSLLSTGELVHQVFRDLQPNASHVGCQDDPSAALEQTKALLARGDSHLSEAALQYQGLLIRADLLERVGGGWHLVEVKSSTSVKDYHLTDAAIQAWVVQGVGLELEKVSLGHINNEFVYPGHGNYQGLFVFEDITKEIQPLLSEVPGWIERFKAVLEGALPEVEPGKQCFSPFECPFWSRCVKDEPEYPVDILPGYSAIEDRLIKEGYKDLRQVPVGLITAEKLRRVWQATVTGEPYIAPELKECLRNIAYPRFYLDFETIQFAVPRWEGTRPYQQLPFQFSCHVERCPGSELEHLSFLDIEGLGPMRDLTASLIEGLGDNGPIITYSHFEKGVLNTLSALLPEEAGRLQQMIPRLYDLLPIMRQHYYHPEMKGSWSIKAILPTIAPELDYDNLQEVNDGSQAQLAYLEMIHPETPADRKKALEEELLIYCGRDSMAMVKIVRFFGD